MRRDPQTDSRRYSSRCESLRADDIAEDAIAMDPTHHCQPVRMMQALQANLDALQKQVAKVIRSEKAARVEDIDGTLRPVTDEAARDTVRPFILDVQCTARTFDDAAQAEI